jgi:hypothetical protein
MGHYHDRKALVTKAFESGVCDKQQLLPFQALKDILRYTMEEVCSVAT